MMKKAVYILAKSFILLFVIFVLFYLFFELAAYERMQSINDFVSDLTDHISLTVGYSASMGLGYALGTYLHPEEIAEPVNAFLNVATTGISHLFKHSIPEGEAGHYHYEYTMTIWGGGVNHQMDQCTIFRCEKGCRETTIDWYSIIGFYANENWGE